MLVEPDPQAQPVLHRPLQDRPDHRVLPDRHQPSRDQPDPQVQPVLLQLLRDRPVIPDQQVQPVLLRRCRVQQDLPDQPDRQAQPLTLLARKVFRVFLVQPVPLAAQGQQDRRVLLHPLRVRQDQPVQ